MHGIIGDIVDWEAAHKVYLAAEGQTGERYSQRLEASDQMAKIEARSTCTATTPLSGFSTASMSASSVRRYW